MRSFTLPARLRLIALVGILPLAIVCGFALHALQQKQYAQAEAAALSAARAVALAVDSELRLTVAALEALALISPLGGKDLDELAAAEAAIVAVRSSHPEWRGLRLVAPSGVVVLRTDGQATANGSEIVEKQSLADVLRTSRPVVGSMARGASGNFAFPVRVPVIRDGSARYVLTAIVRPEAITTVLARQRLPAGWTVSVFDAANARVARSHEDERYRGQLPSATLLSLLETMQSRREQVGMTTNVDGVHVQTAVARTELAPWTVALGASVSRQERVSQQISLAYGVGLVVSLIVGALGAWWMSRSITVPMARLSQSATVSGRGPAIEANTSGIAEIDAVAQALASAARQRERHEAERDALLASERQARSVLEAAEHRLERLVSASAVLSGPMDESTALSAIAQVIVPDVADLCRIDLLDEDGQLQRKLTHHFDPERSREIARMVGTRAAASNVPGSFPWAIATGKPFLFNLDDPDLPEVTDPQMREFVAALGLTAACVVPLVARGRTLGAMAVLQAESGRRFTPDDGALIGELAQRAAVALDNVRLLANARAAQAQAEAANRSKDEFLAMLGHELRNPLAPISLALQLIARKDATVFPRERQIIERQVKHLSLMVDDLLDVSRIVSGKIALKLEEVDLRDVVARALELTLPALQQRQSMPELNLPDSPLPVRGDPTRLAQIVGNLLNNAAKFTSSEGRIELTLATDGAHATLTLADDGIGISPELMPRLFERFVQGEQPLQRASGGLGLGLAIAQSLAQLHGGSIKAFSDGVGRGSRFEFRVPLLADVAQPATSVAPAAASARKIRLLLVDDNRDAVEALASWMELEGHEVSTALSAEEALDTLAQDVPDAGIFDIGLPGMSGYELAQRVRADARTRSMIVIALSGYGRQADRERAIESGFDDHFAKPAQVETMLARIEHLLASTR